MINTNTRAGAPTFQTAYPTPSGSEAQPQPKDVVTLNLKPEQMADKAIQAFIRQMAMEGTPINLNFTNPAEGNSQAVNQAQGFANQAAVSANRAQQEADRAKQIADRIQSGSTSSAPPTYSEG